jgi:two-component system, OmpR family, sensor histidine kinase PhoQ
MNSAKSPLRLSLSISARLFLASSIVVLLFLGAAGYALDKSFHDSAVDALRERLRDYSYSLLQGMEATRSGKLLLPEYLDPELERPGSGFYAAIQAKDLQWISPSAIGRDLPVTAQLKPNESTFAGPIKTNVGGVYVFSKGYVFESPAGDVAFTLHLVQHKGVISRQQNAFRRTMLIYLGTLGLLLLLAQALVLSYSLRPLRGVARDLANVEQGHQAVLIGRYPRELIGLTGAINRFIQSERETLERYRRTLGDLAHSLKTPLAVIRGHIEAEPQASPADAQTLAQVQKMDEIVAYQLARARASGHQTYATPLTVESEAEGIVTSLEKVYASKGILCEFEIDPAAKFHGDKGDLLEVLGNLLDNAFKWANSRVVLSAKSLPGNRSRRAGLELIVEDDGPGIPQEEITELLQRGVKADERVPGHGIGLSIVSDILQSYGGEMKVDRSELGGARFCVTVPPLA